VTSNGERTEPKIMVTYDQWSYMTMIFQVFDVGCGILFGTLSYVGPRIQTIKALVNG